MFRLLRVGIITALLVMSTWSAALLPAVQASGAPSSETVIIVLSASCWQGQGQGARAFSAGQSCAAQTPVLDQLKNAGAKVISTTTLVDTITAQVTPAEAQALAAFPGVSQVLPDSVIPAPVSPPAAQQSQSSNLGGGLGNFLHGIGSQECGTQSHPELDPEALQNINAVQAFALGINGSGVTVAYLADGVDPGNVDFQRNAAYGAAGSPVVTQYDFSGDGTNAPTAGAEAFGDASSIAAQGNTAYNLAQFVNPAQAARLPASGCWIKIVGAAPGASVMGLKVFAQNDDTTESGFLQAIQYAVANGAKVINESFGANNFPDTALDVTREADDAAVAAGVTVVVSSGDAGNTSTIGSPASDPNVISVGATTTFRSYAQSNFGGFDNPAVGNGQWLDNNLSALSSSGFTQAGNTIDLVAPGDLNWALCSTDTAMFSECVSNGNGQPSPIQNFGGTSEASPLTAAAAADVIQAYARTHAGADPSPALVKQILMSSATDIGAPAAEQGAGLLNVLGAVELAGEQPPVTRPPSTAPLLVSPNQVNFVASPNTPESQQISISNPGSSPMHVSLSTRALTQEIADSGVQTFTMDPRNPTTNTGTFAIWSGATEVYQTETFTVPHTPASQLSRLLFAADYRDTNQSSLLHFALFEPNGTYAAYSLPQGLGDYGEVEVANPMPGRWTALFFTLQDQAGETGTKGPVQWDASTWTYGSAGSISPSNLTIGPGQTVTSTLSLTTPSTAGDTDQSIVITSRNGTTTIPITVRSTVTVNANSGGNFSGVLTGGNGRPGAQAQMNSYYFNVPTGETDMDISVAMAKDPCNQLLLFLVNPEGQAVGTSSNYTVDPNAKDCPAEEGVGQSTKYVETYHLAPEPGQWSVVLDWANPVVGNHLQITFKGAIRFNQVSVSGNLPDSSSVTLPPSGGAYQVNITNTGVAPEAFFADARLNNQTASVPLPNWNGNVNASNFTIPLPAGLTFPYYIVPTHTSQLQANVTRLGGTAPVTFDMEYFPGDPDVSPNLPNAAVSSTVAPDGSSASLTLSETPAVAQGLWLLNPDEVGPYPPSGASQDTV
ncbi:MAG TPA: S8 family serine peptidase, partial [Thermomicrobiaceae bacterium]|nr:S8 family serine peptidase [Thermomicrobiaceae bacterium]